MDGKTAKNGIKQKKNTATPALTSREQELFNLLLKGETPKEIAFNLGITHRTVDFHRNNLYLKLDVHSIQELLVKYNSQTLPEVMPIEMATPEKPLVVKFYDNSFYNSETIWQYKIIPSIFYNSRITAGESYLFSYSFTSNINFNFMMLTIIDNSPEANFYRILGPQITQVTKVKANTEYKGNAAFLAVKSTISSEPNGNTLVLEINADKETQPILTFTEFELTKIN
jgi:DNA-binding CsgD family transcriptional regulator